MVMQSKAPTRNAKSKIQDPEFSGARLDTPTPGTTDDIDELELVSEFVPDIHTPLPGPLAEKLVNRDNKVISPSYTRSYPFVMDRGRGNLVWDVDGNRYIDFTAGVAVLNTGHCHPEVVRAVKDQAEKYFHMAGTDFYLPGAIELAETLGRITPGVSASSIAPGR